MNIKRELFLKFFTICFGFTLSFLILELIARIAPARSIFPLERPIECNQKEVINLTCLHRRKAYSNGIWSRGIFKPFNQYALKETNDIGQFSDIDLQTFLKNKNNNIQILAIGDSFVEALQVENQHSFHGILNNLKTNTGKKIISTSIVSSGMAFPNYIASLKYAKTLTNLKDVFITIPIIANDFDESFRQYAIKGRRRGLGQFYFDQNTENLNFIKLPERQTLTQNSIDFILEKSTLSRYLTYNLEMISTLNRGIKFFSKKISTSNINESSRDEKLERLRLGNKAIDIFINNLKDIRNTNYERERTILIIDADRNAIYNEISLNSNSFDQTMRRNIIKKSKENGFKVIDMQPIFNEDYMMKKKRFDSIYDGHWNEYGHLKVSEEIMNIINQLN